MTHNYLFAKSFFIAFLFSLFAGNAWAQSSEPITIAASVEDNADGQTKTIYLYDIYSWNAFVKLYNNVTGADPIEFETEFGNVKYSSREEIDENRINTICIASDFVFNDQVDEFIPIEELQSGHTLTMYPYSYITSISDGDEYSLVVGEVGSDGWGLLVKTNNGTIDGIRIKQLFVNAESRPDMASVSIGLIAQNNFGTIKNCEVIDSQLEFQCMVETNCKFYVGAIAGEIGKEGNKSGIISNCLVKDFAAYLVESNGPILYVAQIVGKDYFKAIKNNCVFIDNFEMVKIYQGKYPYVFTAATEQGDGTTVNYGNIDGSNRAFLLCTVGSEENTLVDASYIVRYDATATENTDQVVNQEGLEAAIKTFCNQEDCDFDFIKYGDYVPGSNPWDFFYNYLDLDGESGFYMPMVHDLYALKPNKDGKYIVSEKSGFRAMANMMANKKDGDPDMYFQFGSEDEEVSSSELSALPTLAIDVPAGCIVDGCGGKYFDEGNAGSYYQVKPDEENKYYPVFGDISGMVKRFVIEIVPAEEEPEYGYSIGLVKYDTGTTTCFGFLANENKGTIESCGITPPRDGITIVMPTWHEYTDSYIAIGSLVGVNSGTIKNVTCGVYIERSAFCLLSDYADPQKLYLGGIAGTNNGTISDVVFTNLDNALTNKPKNADGTFSHGLFVGKNDEEYGTLTNAFAVIGTQHVDGDSYSQYVQYLEYEDSGNRNYTKLKNTEVNVPDADSDNVGYYLNSLSDRADITLLYNVDVVEVIKGKATDPVIPDKNILYVDYPDASLEQASMWIKNFSEPIKWTFGETPMLSMSDINATNITDSETKETVVNAVEIDNDQQLEEIVTAINDLPAAFSEVNISITRDIDMREAQNGTLQLGTEDAPFNGTLNGNGHAISGVEVQDYVSETKEVPTLKDDDPSQTETRVVAQTAGILGTLGETAVVENVEFKDVSLSLWFDGEHFAGVKNFDVPILAFKNKKRIRNVATSVLLDVSTDDLDPDAQVNLTLVGDNGNENTDPNEQAAVENVAVLLKNANLLYKPIVDLRGVWYVKLGSNEMPFTFEQAYAKWCDVANFAEARKDDFKMYYAMLFFTTPSNADIVTPTFESFADWLLTLSGTDLEKVSTLIIKGDVDNSEDIQSLVMSFAVWYYANSTEQKARRTADKNVWEAYYSANAEGNHVAVIATQNLCKSPGKGRTHKVCTAPAGGGNKSVILNPDATDVPATEMLCTLEEFASGPGTYWLNYERERLTGDYGKMFSQGTFNPILASAKNRPLVKLEYTITDRDAVGAEGFLGPSYANEGSIVSLLFTQRPLGIRVAGLLLDNSAYSTDRASFTVPVTPENTGVVDVRIGMGELPTPTALEEIDATEPAEATGISVQGNTLTVSAVEGQQIEVTDLRGVRIAAVKAVGTQTRLTIPNRGIYVVKVGTQATKVAIK